MTDARLAKLFQEVCKRRRERCDCMECSVPDYHDIIRMIALTREISYAEAHERCIDMEDDGYVFRSSIEAHPIH